MRETCNELTFGEIPDAGDIPDAEVDDAEVDDAEVDDAEFDFEACIPGGEFDLWEMGVTTAAPWSRPNPAEGDRGARGQLRRMPAVASGVVVQPLLRAPAGPRAGAGVQA